MVSSIDQQWQDDLVDMQRFEKQKKAYKFILAVIDIFSRYAWALPLKSKRGEEVKIYLLSCSKKSNQKRFSLMRENNSTINILRIYLRKITLNGFQLILIR
jgi:hypothetical protein